MTLPTLSNTMKTYLYGSSSVPDNFVNSLLVRPDDTYSEINGISAQQFMMGPGRFALASSFKIVGDFFDDVNGHDDAPPPWLLSSGGVQSKRAN